MTSLALRRFMLLRGWSAYELAIRIPVSERTVFYWLSGGRKISRAMAERIKNLPKDAKPVKPTKG